MTQPKFSAKVTFFIEATKCSSKLILMTGSRSPPGSQQRRLAQGLVGEISNFKTDWKSKFRNRKSVSQIKMFPKS